MVLMSQQHCFEIITCFGDYLNPFESLNQRTNPAPDPSMVLGNQHASGVRWAYHIHSRGHALNNSEGHAS